ncbi:hypothetical protein PB2503_06287 [Parvularcula bermudensis HTCC2503]|uniref:Strictosidine synthase conserved region domain-containing protein n=2 Tax=Parvularcula TaxID=208215 RepID=E0THM7_PARBH|nr:hypothetical protein PB2503_06287 [Parvularcula bermudensis HTCC2503]
MPPIERIPLPLPAPEDVVVAEGGQVYTALRDDGVLVELPSGGSSARVCAEIGGRGLGVELYGDGRLLVCNATMGLQAVDPVTGRVESLLSQIDGRPIGVCNNASVGRDGTVYFSESSRVHPLDHYRRDLIENTRSGQLLRWRPGTAPEPLLSGIAFANGVVLSPEEDFVLLAETGLCQIHRYWLSGPRAGQADLFAALPGFPDNLSLGTDGLFWAAIAAPRVATAEAIHKLPRPLRALIARLPESLGPQAEKTCEVMAFDGEGQVVHHLRGDASRFHQVSGVREHNGVLWLGSIEEEALGRVVLR